MLFHGSKVIINFTLSEKGVRFIDGIGFSSGNPAWAHVFMAAAPLERTHDEGNKAASSIH